MPQGPLTSHSEEEGEDTPCQTGKHIPQMEQHKPLITKFKQMHIQYVQEQHHKRKSTHKTESVTHTFLRHQRSLPVLGLRGS